MLLSVYKSVYKYVTISCVIFFLHYGILSVSNFVTLTFLSYMDVL